MWTWLPQWQLRVVLLETGDGGWGGEADRALTLLAHPCGTQQVQGRSPGSDAALEGWAEPRGWGRAEARLRQRPTGGGQGGPHGRAQAWLTPSRLAGRRGKPRFSRPFSHTARSTRLCEGRLRSRTRRWPCARVAGPGAPLGRDGGAGPEAEAASGSRCGPAGQGAGNMRAGKADMQA